MGYMDKFTPEPEDGLSAQPVQERRSGERYVTVLKVGRAIVGDRDQLCLVRNFSSAGMKIHMPHDAAPDERVTIELRSDRVIHGTVRWSHEHSNGVEFDTPVRVEDILDKRPPSSVLRYRPRSPRFHRQSPARIEHESGVAEGTLTDISLQGACVELKETARMGDHVVFHIPGLPARAAQVRWVRGKSIGVHFERCWSFNELAAWLDEHDPA